MHEQFPTHYQQQLIRERHQELRSTAQAARLGRGRGSLTGDRGAIRIRLRVRERSRFILSTLGVTRTLSRGPASARGDAAPRSVQ